MAQNVTVLLPMVSPSFDQLGRIIGPVAGLGFLLCAVSAFISAVVARRNRVIHRLQFVNSVVDGDNTKSYARAEIRSLNARADLLKSSLFWSITAAIVTALTIGVILIGAMLGVVYQYGVAILFVGTLVLFCLSLIDLAREVRGTNCV